MTAVFQDIKDKNTKSTITIFIEGNENSFDKKVMQLLLQSIERKIDIKPLGSVTNLTTAAKAFKDVHPDYIYIIDRDYRKDNEVDESWEDFEQGKGNCIIWHRRELENYFLDPEYIVKCGSLKNEYKKIDDLSKFILDKSTERVYHSAAYILMQRQDQKLRSEWEKAFKKLKLSKFASKQIAIQSLKSIQKDLSSKIQNQSNTLSNGYLEKEYQNTLKEFFGNKNDLHFGSGKWIDLIDGKKIWEIISSTCMNQKKLKKGTDPEISLIRAIIRGNRAKQPDDFTKLVDLLSKRIKSF
jgi:hypothetical protein